MTSPLAEELPAVPAVVAPLRQGEANAAAGAAVPPFVLHPVVGRRAPRLVAHRPAEHPAAPVAHQDLTVVPAGHMHPPPLGLTENCDSSSAVKRFDLRSTPTDLISI